MAYDHRPLFEKADYNARRDPLDRIFGYLDFRAMIADGPLEAITCFAGTTVQEVFATSDAIWAACDATIGKHVVRLAADRCDRAFEKLFSNFFQ